MRLAHSIQNYRIEKETKGLDQSGFILTNNAGGYLWLDARPSSRYQGFFFAPKKMLGKSMVKVVEDVALVGGQSVWAIDNNFSEVTRSRGSLSERFFVPAMRDAFVYELDRASRFDLFLDVREYNDHNEAERHYEIFASGGTAVVRFTHPGLPVDELFVAVVTDGAIETKNEWVCRNYEFDQRRNSPPGGRWVFLPLRISGKAMAVSAALSREKAIAEAKDVFENRVRLRRKASDGNGDLFKKFIASLGLKGAAAQNKEPLVAEFAAARSLASLLVADGAKPNLYAGLPWFFQFWRRDTAVSLAALAGFDWIAARDIFLNYLESFELGGFCSDKGDDYGWLFLRGRDLVRKNLLSANERAAMAFVLEKTLDNDLSKRTRNGLAVVGAGQTWMDSLRRGGAPVEIQALRLSMLDLAAQLAATRARAEFYTNQKKELLKNTYNTLWNGKFLADGFDCDAGRADFAIRPNLFLAWYAYPNLLAIDEWRTCFKYVLPHLWCDWGGVSSLDRDDAAFRGTHSGENPASYHNGDSWFYVNNIAAIAMHCTDPRRFSYYVKKIIHASTYELLWSGALGHLSELSPAGMFDSNGALAQAWSSATYLELLSALRGA